MSAHTTWIQGAVQTTWQSTSSTPALTAASSSRTAAASADLTDSPRKTNARTSADHLSVCSIYENNGIEKDVTSNSVPLRSDTV